MSSSVRNGLPHFTVEVGHHSCKKDGLEKHKASCRALLRGDTHPTLFAQSLGVLYHSG